MTQVRQFHLRFDLPAPLTPVLRANSEDLRLRMRLLTEEYEEVKVEVTKLCAIDAPFATVDLLRSLLKELADLRYTIESMAVSLGLPIDEAFDAVHASNMTKFAPEEPGGKVRKGEDYVEPNMALLVHDIITIPEEEIIHE